MIRVHRIRRHETDRRTAGPPKACSSCWRISLDPFAAQTFSYPHRRRSGQRGTRQDRAEFDGITVGVAVQLGCRGPNRIRHIVDERPTRRMRILVGVESHGDIELRCAIRTFASQVVPDQQLRQADSTAGRSPSSFETLIVRTPHRSNLRRTASPVAADPRRWPV